MTHSRLSRSDCGALLIRAGQGNMLVCAGKISSYKSCTETSHQWGIPLTDDGSSSSFFYDAKAFRCLGCSLCRFFTAHSGSVSADLNILELLLELRQSPPRGIIQRPRPRPLCCSEDTAPLRGEWELESLGANYERCLWWFKENGKDLGYIKKSDEMNKAGTILKLFNLQNTTDVNFGANECPKEIAAECNASKRSWSSLTPAWSNTRPSARKNG